MVIPIKDGCPSSRQTDTGKHQSGLVLVRRLSVHMCRLNEEHPNLHIRRLSDEQLNLHMRRLNDERPKLYIRHLEHLIIAIDTVRQLHRRIGHVNRLTIIHRRIHHALM